MYAFSQKFSKYTLKLLFYNFSKLFQIFLKIISHFSDNFSQVFPKIDTKIHEISIRMFKKLYKIFPTFLQNFFTISQRLEGNIFNILHNFRKINNLKLSTHTFLRNFFRINPKIYYVIFPTFILNFQEIS